MDTGREDRRTERIGGQRGRADREDGRTGLMGGQG